MSDGTYVIRNVNCDSYADYINQFSQAQLGHIKGRVPVLRVFGLTAEGKRGGGAWRSPQACAAVGSLRVPQTIIFVGKKCCAHIHGIFPSISIRTKSPLSAHSKQLLTTTLTNLLTQVPDLHTDPEGPIVAIEEQHRQVSTDNV